MGVCRVGGAQLNLGVEVACLGQVSQSFAPSLLNFSVSLAAYFDALLHKT